MKRLPLHFIIERKKEVIFYIMGGFSITMVIPIFLKQLPVGYIASVIRCEETFFKMRYKCNAWNNRKEESIESVKFKKTTRVSFENGVQSLTNSWFFGVLYTRWKQLTGFRVRRTPNCQSLFLEWEKRFAKSELYVLFQEDVSYPDWSEIPSHDGW